jgi:hypothetical protein
MPPGGPARRCALSRCATHRCAAAWCRPMRPAPGCRAHTPAARSARTGSTAACPRGPWGVEVQVGELLRLALARHAVQDGDLHEVAGQRGQLVAALGARAQLVAQQGPAAGDIVQLDAARLAEVQVHADHRAHAAHAAAHHVHRKVVERATVAQQVALVHHGRQCTGDGDAGQQRLHQAATAHHLFAGARVVGGHAVVVLPQVFHLGREAH